MAFSSIPWALIRRLNGQKINQMDGSAMKISTGVKTKRNEKNGFCHSVSEAPTAEPIDRRRSMRINVACKVFLPWACRPTWVFCLVHRSWLVVVPVCVRGKASDCWDRAVAVWWGWCAGLRVRASWSTVPVLCCAGRGRSSDGEGV